jgi:signal transduction histidine kinase
MSSSLDSIYKKLASSLEPGHTQEIKFDPERQISPAVAHELNNVLAIVQGYAERLLLKHGENPALETHLKLIAEAARRATTIVRDALPPKPASDSIRQISPPQLQPVAA